MLKKLASILIVSAGVSLAASGHAAMLFSDDFDSDNAAGALNFDGLINWTVSDGTIDYIRQGGWGISCFGGNGGCLDMDGSTANAGRITSRATFTIVPGTMYFLDAQISGNQRGGAADSFSMGFIDTATNSAFGVLSASDISFGAPFGNYTSGFLGSDPLAVRLFFEGFGADNIGVILDNVVFRDHRQSVPEPGTLALLGLGFTGLAASRRRKQ